MSRLILPGGRYAASLLIILLDASGGRKQLLRNNRGLGGRCGRRGFLGLLAFLFLLGELALGVSKCLGVLAAHRVEENAELEEE